VTEQSHSAETAPETATPPAPVEKPYDMRRLSYAGTFRNPFKANTIRAIEWLTAKISLLRLIRSFEQSGAPFGAPFWPKAIRIWASASTRRPRKSPASRRPGRWWWWQTIPRASLMA
jgi:hypothetical protein